MTRKKFILSAVVVLMLSCVASSQKVTGVWRIDSVTTTGPNGNTTKATQPSLYLFTGRHYSIIYVNSDKPRSTDDAAKMTSAQLLETYVDDFVANAGTYEVKAGKLTMHIMVAKSPTFMQGGNWAAYQVKVTGNTMTLVTAGNSLSTAPVSNPTTFTLTRVE